MKNKGLLTRQGLGALGGHKALVQGLPGQPAAQEADAQDQLQQTEKPTMPVPGAASVLPKDIDIFDLLVLGDQKTSVLCFRDCPIFREELTSTICCRRNSTRQDKLPLVPSGRLRFC